MTVPKLSTRSHFESSRIMNNLATSFEVDRNVPNLLRLLMAISESGHPIQLLNELIDYLEETSTTGIPEDWRAIVYVVQKKDDQI